jgi:hypothetical protein
MPSLLHKPCITYLEQAPRAQTKYVPLLEGKQVALLVNQTAVVGERASGGHLGELGREDQAEYLRRSMGFAVLRMREST